MRMQNYITGFGIALAMLLVRPLAAQTDRHDRDDDYSEDIKIDRYLDVEVWPNHSDGEYYEKDKIVIHYRVSSDAFVAVYSIDSRGRVNLLFPSEPGEDNFVRGGITNDLPGGDDDYDLVVSGPEGMEHIQIIASREKFPIPNWYHNSGLVFDGEDRNDYMDHLNSRHFIRYGGQRFAFDRAVLFINEWEDYYYRPVYYEHYPSWAVYGNVYIDYPYGGSVYINGLYYGYAPLYIPRLLVGWHYITIYDHHGYGWEEPFHVSYYNTAVFNYNHIHTRPHLVSRYKTVRSSGYRNPVTSGYPNFKTRQVVRTSGSGGDRVIKTQVAGSRKYARGSTKIKKTSRGYETVSVARGERVKSTGRDTGTRYQNRREGSQVGQVNSRGVSVRRKTEDSYHEQSSRDGRRSRTTARSTDSGRRKSDEYYLKKSGSSSSRESGKRIKSTARKSGARDSSKKVKAKSGSRKSDTEAGRKSAKASKSTKKASSSKGKSGSPKKVKPRKNGKSSKQSGKSPGRSGSVKKSGGQSSTSAGQVSGRSSGRSASGRRSGSKSSGGRSKGSKGGRPK